MSSPEAIALFLDFDGTLVEIAPRPDAVRVPPDLVPVLERLRARLDGALAIVTGRPVAVIDDFLAPARLDVAGLHGAALRVGGAAGAGSQAAPELRAWIARLEAETAGRAGVLIEDKGLSVGVHWRLASPEDAAAALSLVERAAADLGPAYRVQTGKAVGEILPAAATKGQAIATLMAQPPYAGRRPVFLGDDRTDELAFASVAEAGGVCVRVGDEETVAARRLPSPAAVRARLAAWAEGQPIDPDGLPAA